MTGRKEGRREEKWPGEKWLDTDEADMHVEEAWFNETLAKRCIKALDRNNIPGYYAPSRTEALSQVMDLIPSGARVGIGDSVTLFQIGAIEALEKRVNNEIVFSMRKEGKYYFPETMEKFVETGLKALDTDVFITGTNAITLDGKLLSIDAVGNRVAGLIFGPKKVIVVAGVNKIVADIEEARERVKRIAGPVVAARHCIKHLAEESMPSCAKTGICMDCHVPERICCFTVVVEYQRKRRIHVVLVGQSLGA